MKKRFLLLVATTLVTNAFAQKNTTVSSRISDNWFIGINGGVSSKTTGHAVFQNLNPQAGLTVGRYLTPSFGLSLNAQAGFDNAPRTPETSLFVKGTNLTLQGMVNLNNLFTGYNGTPDLVEVVALAGLGWTREYEKESVADDANYLTSKFGFQVNFNLCKSKAWQINLEPSIVYNLTGAGALHTHNAGQQPYLHVGNSTLNLMAGVTYKFKNSNGTHNFASALLRDQTEIDMLNARINGLRSEINTKDGQINEVKRDNADLKKKLEECLNKAPEKEVVVEIEKHKALESVVTFGQGRTSVDNSQLPNVERIATFLKNNPKSTVVIKGFASPEGSVEVNVRIARQRAEAVQTLLVNRYKIAASRISAEGNGIGNMFSEPDWNRVSICTIQE